MDLYAKQTETLTTGAGNAYRVVSRARWDMDPWGSGIEIYAKAYAPGGSRRWRPYKEHGGRGCPTDPVGEPPAGWTPHRRWWQRRFARPS